MAEWTPAQIAGYDQELKAADEELDRLVRALQIGIGADGERQAVANVGTMLMQSDGTHAAVLLTVALRRLAGTPS